MNTVTLARNDAQIQLHSNLHLLEMIVQEIPGSSRFGPEQTVAVQDPSYPAYVDTSVMMGPGACARNPAVCEVALGNRGGNLIHPPQVVCRPTVVGPFPCWAGRTVFSPGRRLFFSALF